MTPMWRWIVTVCSIAALSVTSYAYLFSGAADTFSVRDQTIQFLSPRWLGLLSLGPLLWLVHSYSLVDMSKIQRGASLVLRTVLLLIIALALSRPATTTKETRTAVVLLVDVSDSVSDDQIESAQRIVQSYWRTRKENDVFIVTFASHPRRIGARTTGSKAVDNEAPRLQRHSEEHAGSYSDVQAAIQHAYGIFPSNRIPRIVLLTDGNETQGDALAEAYRATERKIPIHVHPLPPRRSKEVLVKSLNLPPDIRIGTPFELTATIYATHEDTVRLTLYKDEFINSLDGQKKVEIHPGKNVVRFKSLVREAGFVSYRLAMSAPKQDTWSTNNTASALLPVIGRPRVLYIEGEPTYATYLKRALQAEKIDVTVRGPHGVPSKAASLAKFDLLIMSDVPAMYLGMGQMGAIHAYVRDLGGGFIMIGGPNSFGAGGYYGTRIEKILPVQFDTEKKRDQPSLGLMLAIDRSGSMTGPKIELAKDAARATAELLGRNDLIGIVAFDSSAHTVVRLQRAANRFRIANDIASLRAGGGTNIRPALQEAYNQLSGARAKVKHVILLSDGQSSYGGIPELVDEMVGRGITVSAVGVGGGADRTLLQMIAERGNGRFYHTNDANNIPKIFTKETTQVARSAVVEELVQVIVAKRAGVIKGIDMAAAPHLRGYVSTRAKPLSETILISNRGEPILATWRVGLGKTAAFTSDAKNRWAVHWLRWPGYQKFWGQLVRDMMRHRVQRAFSMNATHRGGMVHVSIDAIDRNDRFINDLSSDLSVINPQRSGNKRSFPLYQTAAGRYEADFRLPRHGAFLLRARHKLDGRVIAESVGAISAPYPSEYTNLMIDEAALGRIATVSKGKMNPKPASVFAANGQTIEYHRDLWPWLIAVLIGVLILDVGFRRIRFFGHRQFVRVR